MGIVPLRTSASSELLVCPRCGGMGTTGVTHVRCLLCLGTGTASPADALDYSRELFVPCTDCNGSGEPGNANCDQCHGSGQITAETAESSRDCADFIQRIEERFGFSRLLSLPSAFAATLRQLLTGQKLPRGGRPLLHQQASVDQSVFIMEDEYTKTLVLGYHDVVPHKDFKRSGFQSPDANIYKVDRADFSQHLGAILDNPTRWLFFRKLRKVVLTFDDGGVSAIDVAKMIEQFGWRGYFFVTTDRIGSRGFLNEAQLRTLRSSGHVIGSHSCSHPIRMACCTEEQLEREWSESVRVLERILGERVTTASLPGGYYSRMVAAAAARAGIRTLFTSEPITSTRIVDGCLVVGRFTVQRGTSEQRVASLIAGDLWPRLQCYLFWNCKKLMKAIGGDAWLKLRCLILARRK